MKRFKTWRKFWSINWRVIVAWASVIGLTLAVFLVRLKTLNSGASFDEIRYIQDSNSAEKLFSTPVFFLHRLGTYALFKLGAQSVVWYRLLSVAFGLVATFSMFYILRSWYTKRVALIGTFLFASSSIVLHSTRSALPQVSYLLVLFIIAVGLWLQKTRHHKRALAALVVCLSLTVYMPGFVWISVAVLAQQGKRIARAFVRAPKLLQAGCIFAISVLLAPLAYSLFQHPLESLAVAGLPQSLGTVSSHIEHIKHSLLAIGWQYNNAPPSLWLATTPIFEVVSLVMIVLGFYSLRFERSLKRARLQVALPILFGLLILIDGPVSFVALAAVLSVVLAGGLAFMLQQWFTVFPRNPFARTLAIALVAVSIIGVGYYHTYRYFVAWPQATQTKAAFSDSYLVK